MNEVKNCDKEGTSQEQYSEGKNHIKTQQKY